MPFSHILAAACLSAILALPLFAAPSALAAAKRGGFAGVAADGSLAYGKGVKKAKRISDGRYLVTFERRITGCAYFVQAGNPTPGGLVAGAITTGASRDLTRGKKLHIFTVFEDMGLADHPFFVQAVC